MQNFCVLISFPVPTQFHSVLATTNNNRMICLKTFDLQMEERGNTYNANAVNSWLYLLLCLERNYMFMSNLSFFSQEASISVLLPAAHGSIMIQL